MPDLSKDEKLAALRHEETIVAEKLQETRERQARIAALRQELGKDAPPLPTNGNDGPAEKVQSRKEAALLFDALTPAELTNLYLTDRPRWSEILAAKEQAGVDKLLRRFP